MLMLKEVDEVQSSLIRVVVIEDYRLIRLGLCSMLQDDSEIQVIGDAEDAEQGLEMIFALRPTVVLMDLGLPGISGIEATQQIKTFDETIKVIVYTSHETQEDVIAALGSGADAYCIKDTNPRALINTIKAVAKGVTWLDPAVATIALEIFRNSAVIPPNLSEPRLSERELQILTLMVDGKSNLEIAQSLVISHNTVKEHVSNILHKLAVNDRVQAAVKAVKDGLV